MKLDQISLKGFKCFTENTTVDFSKITLLTGENSSGKSSLIYGILCALQSNFPLHLSPNGDYVNMGDFREMAFGHEIDNSIEMTFKFGIPDDSYNVETHWKANPKNIMPEISYLKIKTNNLNLEIIKNQKYILNAQFDLNSISGKNEAKLIEMVTSFVDSLTSADLVPASKTSQSQNAKEKFSFKDVKDLSFKDLEELEKKLVETKNIQVKIWINSIANYFKLLEKNMNYISSFRLQPERTYYQKTNTDIKVRKHGDNTVDQILEWRSNRSVEFKELVGALRDLKLLNLVTMRKFSGGRFEPRIEIRSGGVWASLADVGFGISQFLPIIVADLQLPKGSTLLVSQPEIHLHPSVQADMGDYFVGQVKKKDKRYILETHSEYLMNRIRKSIVKGTLKEEDVSVYYFENIAKGTRLHRINFTKDGEIKNAPKGFFETYQMEIMDIALSI